MYLGFLNLDFGNQIWKRYFSKVSGHFSQNLTFFGLWIIYRIKIGLSLKSLRTTGLETGPKKVSNQKYLAITIKWTFNKFSIAAFNYDWKSDMFPMGSFINYIDKQGGRGWLLDTQGIWSPHFSLVWYWN